MKLLPLFIALLLAGCAADSDLCKGPLFNVGCLMDKPVKDGPKSGDGK